MTLNQAPQTFEEWRAAYCREHGLNPNWSMDSELTREVVEAAWDAAFAAGAISLHPEIERLRLKPCICRDLHAANCPMYVDHIGGGHAL